MASARAIEAGRAVLRVVAVEDGVKAVLDGITAELQRTANNIRNIGLSITAIGAGGVLSLLPAIRQAANAQEVLSKFETVFGRSSEAVRLWGATLADEIGRSETKIAEIAASFQDLLVPVGFNQGPAREVSKELAQLAFDLASFNNQVDDDSVRDLQAALTGSSETMKKYGVVVNEAAVKQELLNRNLNPQSASEVEKIQARLAIIYRQTSAAQGDAARTAGSLVNEMKGLGAAVQGTAEAVGTSFLPVATGLVSAARAGVKFVGDLVTTIPGLSTAAGVAAAGLVAMGAAVSGFGLLIASALSPINLAVLSIRLLNSATTTFLGISLVAKARTLALSLSMRVLATSARTAGVAMSFLAKNPIVLGITAITLGLTALAGAYALATREVENFQAAANGTTITAAAQSAQAMADELERLAKSYGLSAEQQDKANAILNELGDSYNTFGIAVDSATGRIIAQADAFGKLRVAIAGAAKEQLEGQITTEQENLAAEQDRLARLRARASRGGQGRQAAGIQAEQTESKIAQIEERLAELREQLTSLPDPSSPNTPTGELSDTPGRASGILSKEFEEDIRRGMIAESDQILADLKNISDYERRLRNEAIDAELRASLEKRELELALLEEQKQREIRAAEEVGAATVDIERRFAAERARVNKEFDSREEKEAEQQARKERQRAEAERRASLGRLRQNAVQGTLATRVAGQQFGASERIQQQQLGELRQMNQTIRRIERKPSGLRAI